MEESNFPRLKRAEQQGKVTLVETNVKLDKIIKNYEKLADFEDKLGFFSTQLEKAKEQLKEELSQKLERNEGIEYLSELTYDKDTAIHQNIADTEEKFEQMVQKLEEDIQEKLKLKATWESHDILNGHMTEIKRFMDHDLGVILQRLKSKVKKQVAYKAGQKYVEMQFNKLQEQIQAIEQSQFQIQSSIQEIESSPKSRKPTQPVLPAMEDLISADGPQLEQPTLDSVQLDDDQNNAGILIKKTYELLDSRIQSFDQKIASIVQRLVSNEQRSQLQDQRLDHMESFNKKTEKHANSIVTERQTVFSALEESQKIREMVQGVMKKSKDHINSSVDELKRDNESKTKRIITLESDVQSLKRELKLQKTQGKAREANIETKVTERSDDTRLITNMVKTLHGSQNNQKNLIEQIQKEINEIRGPLTAQLRNQKAELDTLNDEASKRRSTQYQTYDGSMSSKITVNSPRQNSSTGRKRQILQSQEKKVSNSRLSINRKQIWQSPRQNLKSLSPMSMNPKRLRAHNSVHFDNDLLNLSLGLAYAQERKSSPPTDIKFPSQLIQNMGNCANACAGAWVREIAKEGDGSNSVNTSDNALPILQRSFTGAATSPRTIDARDQLVLVSIFRAYTTRKNIQVVKNAKYQVKVTFEPVKIVRSLESIPNYSNQNTRAAEEKAGKLECDLPELPENVETKGPVELQRGQVYVGQWLDDKRHGFGKNYWIDGSTYEGCWENDEANGIGRLIHLDGNFYQGEWLNGKANGHGVFVHLDNARYEGEWLNDKQNGHGVETWPDGAVYKGNYLDGFKDGQGEFNWADGSSYIGEFSNNNIHGVGIYQWADRRKYNGQWQNNKMHGTGIFIWADGRCYEGEYNDDKKEGNGKFIWPNGKVYEGGWLAGKQNGVGVYTTTKGKTRKGEWKLGKRVKWTD